jgi:hypothetical protein
MWLATEKGFYSIVEKRSDVERGTLTIRGRVRQDLENLRALIPELSDIQEDAKADYRFRVTASRESIATAVAGMVRTLSYPNFKDRIAEVQGDERAAIYHGVWSAFRRLQQPPRQPVDPSIPRFYASIGRRPDLEGDQDPLQDDPSKRLP